MALRPHRGSGCWVLPFGPLSCMGGQSHRVLVHPGVSVLNCPWISFLTLQGSGICRGQGSLAHPGCRQPLGIPAPWHATGPIPSGFAICLLPLLILCAGARTYFRSRNGTRKEQKECVGSRALHGGAHPGRGCSGSSSRGSTIIPSRDLSSLGTPRSPQSVPQAQDPLCMGPTGQRHSTGSANLTPLFFSLKVCYQTAASYGGAGLSLPHYGTAQLSFTTPGPVTSPSQLCHCHSWLWGHVLSPPSPRGSSTTPGTGSTAAPSLHFRLTLPNLTLQHFPNTL